MTSPAFDGSRVLAADDGPLQMSLFDQQHLAEITSPDYPADLIGVPIPLTLK